jgi:hypothetical protein
MIKKHLSISMLFFVFGFSVVVGATSMKYPFSIPQDAGYIMRYDADDIDSLLKKISVLQPSYLKSIDKATELNRSGGNKPDTLMRLPGGEFKQWLRLDTFGRGQILSGHQSSIANSVSEPAIMLLLGSGLVVISSLGRKKMAKKRKH